MKLAGKVALVTGSSQGIGQSIVLRLAESGADVVINYRSHPEGAEETLAKVQAIGGKCHIAQNDQSAIAQGYTIQADLRSVAEVQQLIVESIEHFGKLDIPTDADYITGSTFFVDGGLLWNYQEQ